MEDEVEALDDGLAEVRDSDRQKEPEPVSVAPVTPAPSDNVTQMTDEHRLQTSVKKVRARKESGNGIRTRKTDAPTPADLGMKMPSADKESAAKSPTVKKSVAKAPAKSEKKAASPPRKSDNGGGEKFPLCLCGCGDRTRGGKFRPGHDARYYSAERKAGKTGHGKHK